MDSLADTVAVYLDQLWRVIVLSLGANPAAVAVVRASPTSAALVLGVGALAGISLLLGQSAVLFANRVSPGRFMLSLGLNAVLNVINLLIWGVTVSVLAWLLYSISIPIWSACVIILLGSAPLVFAFLTLLPYLGVPLSWVLEIWSFIIVIVFLGDLVALTLPQAFVIAVWGWLFIEVLNRALGDRLGGMRNWIWRTVTGTRYAEDTRDLVADVTRRLSGELAGHSAEHNDAAH
ncbi:MAG: hypothetical protein U0768_13335 [Anaerolineae bacterium]